MKSFKTYLKEQDSRTQQSTSRTVRLIASDPRDDDPRLRTYHPGNPLTPKGDLRTAPEGVYNPDERVSPTISTRRGATVSGYPKELLGPYDGARHIDGRPLRTDPAPTPLELMNQFYSDRPSDDTSNLGYVEQIVRTRLANPNYARVWPQNFQDFRLDQPFELPVEADDKKPRILTSRPPEMKFKLDNDPDSMNPPQGMDTGVLAIEPNGRQYTLGSIQAGNLGIERAAENISGKSTEIDPRIPKAITDYILSQPRTVPADRGPYISPYSMENMMDVPQQGADYAITSKNNKGEDVMFRMGKTNWPWNQDFSVIDPTIPETDNRRPPPRASGRPWPRGPGSNEDIPSYGAFNTGDIPGVSIPHSIPGSSPLQRSVLKLAKDATGQLSLLKQKYKIESGQTISPTSPNSDVNRFVDFVIPNLGSSEELSRYLELLVPRQTPEEFSQSLKDAQDRVSFGRTQAGNTETPKPSDEDVQKELLNQESKRKEKAYREALEKAARIIAKGKSSQPLDPDTRMA